MNDTAHATEEAHGAQNYDDDEKPARQRGWGVAALECSRVRNQSRDAEAWRPIEEEGRRRLPNWADATEGGGKA